MVYSILLNVKWDVFGEPASAVLRGRADPMISKIFETGICMSTHEAVDEGQRSTQIVAISNAPGPSPALGGLPPHCALSGEHQWM